MRVGKKKIIEMALAHPTIQKIEEGIVRTERRSDHRDLMVDAFTEFFTKIATELMKENIGYEFDEDIVVKSRITFSGERALRDTTGMGTKILTLLCNEDNFKFYIEIEEDTCIILRDFEVHDEDDMCGVELFMRVFYKEDEEENKKIDEVLKVLRKR